jgi:hypothetical protein
VGRSRVLQRASSMRLGVHLLSAAMVLAWTANARARTPQPDDDIDPVALDLSRTTVLVLRDQTGRSV